MEITCNLMMNIVFNPFGKHNILYITHKLFGSYGKHRQPTKDIILLVFVAHNFYDLAAKGSRGIDNT